MGISADAQNWTNFIEGEILEHFVLVGYFLKSLPLMLIKHCRRENMKNISQWEWNTLSKKDFVDTTRLTYMNSPQQAQSSQRSKPNEVQKRRTEMDPSSNP